MPQIFQNPIRYWHDVSRCIILKSSRNLTLGTCDRVYLVVDRHCKSANAYMSLYYSVTCTHILATLKCLWFWGLPSHVSCWPDGVGGCQKLPTVWHFASGTHLPFFSTPKWPQNDPNFWLVILETICSSGKKIWATFISQKMTKIASEDWAYYIRKMKIWHSTVVSVCNVAWQSTWE